MVEDDAGCPLVYRFPFESARRTLIAVEKSRVMLEPAVAGAGLDQVLSAHSMEEPMKSVCAVVLSLLVVLPLSAADASFYGTWKMRPSGVPGSSKSTQVQTITQAGDGIKVNAVIDMGNGTTMSLSYTLKLDGVEVPVYSAGKVVMTMRAKRTGPNTWEGTTAANGMTSQFKTTISADGKVLTTESINQSFKQQSVFDRVN